MLFLTLLPTCILANAPYPTPHDAMNIRLFLIFFVANLLVEFFVAFVLLKILKLWRTKKILFSLLVANIIIYPLFIYVLFLISKTDYALYFFDFKSANWWFILSCLELIVVFLEAIIICVLNKIRNFKSFLKILFIVLIANLASFAAGVWIYFKLDKDFMDMEWYLQRFIYKF